MQVVQVSQINLTYCWLAKQTNDIHACMHNPVDTGMIRIPRSRTSSILEGGKRRKGNLETKESKGGSVEGVGWLEGGGCLQGAGEWLGGGEYKPRGEG